MKEADIQNLIRLALNDYAVVFRVNTGSVKTNDGRWFSCGVPKGHPDLAGFRKSDGKAIYIEVKNEKGKLRKEQKKFLDTVSQYDVIAGVCRSASEAVELVKNG